MFSTEFWIQILITISSLAATWGGVLVRLKHLEKKMDKHNNIVERLTRCEENSRQAHIRLDNIR